MGSVADGVSSLELTKKQDQMLFICCNEATNDVDVDYIYLSAARAGVRKDLSMVSDIIGYRRVCRTYDAEPDTRGPVSLQDNLATPNVGQALMSAIWLGKTKRRCALSICALGLRLESGTRFGPLRA